MNARVTAAELDAMEARIAAVEARLAKGRTAPGRENAPEPDLTDAKLLLGLRTFAKLNELSEQGREAVEAYLDARVTEMEERVARMEKRVEPGPTE